MTHSGRSHDESQDARHARPVDLLGQKTAEIVHDFNNLFQGVIGTLNTLRAYLAQGRIEEAQRLVDDATAATMSAAESTRRLLTFVRREPSDAAPVDVNAVVETLSPLMRGALGPAISLDLDLATGVWPVMCERNALENALLNLAINARDAMGERGGAFSIVSRRVTLSPTDAEAMGGAPGNFVRLQVSDNGPGMAEEVRERVFEPFFTTKPAGKGTGLGLSMVAGFAHQCGGWIDLVTAPGEGTTLTLYLPGRPAMVVPPVARPPAPAPKPSPGVGTVLVVEDEMVVRALIVEVLRDRGYTVLEAADGTEGLGVLIGAHKIDLLISDLGLPGLGGREMAEVARAQRPDLRILFMTGQIRETDSALVGVGTALIMKPFTMEELAARAGAMLAGV